MLNTAVREVGDLSSLGTDNGEDDEKGRIRIRIGIGIRGVEKKD